MVRSSGSAGIVTPYLFYYLMHDALAKPLPEANPAPALAESWSASADGMTHEFVLRPGTKFHDNTPVTAEDVHVLVRTLPRRVAIDAEGSSRRRGDQRRADGPLSNESPVAGFLSVIIWA